MDGLKDLIAEHKIKIGILIVIMTVALIMSLITKPSDSAPLEPLSEQKDKLEISTEVTTEVPAKKEMIVDVKGAVKHGGVYRTDQSKRVVDIIDLAEPLSNADMEAVNLSMQLTDQMVIYVPYKGEVKEEKFEMYGQTTTKNDSEGQVVNINTATESELQNIPGIGPKKAADILMYREQHNGFKSKEEIKEIKGIGDKTYMTLEPFIEL
ncbi:helix-hairpin-helix domain-containing protein [Macrococcus hajekii]|nr:helix-hairpin-helix domain-containing protein [Macrococcus hajekii]